jgi:tetratricopeptide (TPR) repeat protein
MKKLLILFVIIIISATSVFANASNTEAILQYNQGIDYYKIGQYDNAITSFRAAIKLDPNYIDAYYNLGSVLEYLQQYDAALAVFKQIIVRKPEDYDSVYKAAWLSYKLGEPQKAKTYLSIIPSDCARAKDAQTLASQLDFVMPPEQTALETTPKSTPIAAQGSELYQNISAPTGITSDSDGNIYVAEFNTNTIMKISPDNQKTVYIKDSKISGPIGIAMDKEGNIYIANYNKDNVLKVSQYGEISILISNVKKPYYLYVKDNMLFISCQESNSVLKYKLY